MAKHNDLGKEGEQIALEFLINNGYQILEKNYRFKRSEIDLVILKDKIIAFVEIKTRSNKVFDMPENAVNNKKIAKLQEGALHYIESNNIKEEVRFDILTIIKNRDTIEINHIIDAFWG